MVKPGGTVGYQNPVQRIIAFFMSIIYFIMAFFNSMFQPFMSESSGSSRYSRGSGNGGGSGGSGGSGNGPQRRIGRLNTSTMDMSSCPTGGCCGR
uniref:Glycine-rich protein n=1 Tax=Panagrolaimus sp. JU765 TaxID=591449 RepID=A0AC34PUA7_9BILA